MEEESWRRNRFRSFREASGRLLGNICKPSGEHLRAIWKVSGSWEGQGRPEAVLEEQNLISFLFTMCSRAIDHSACMLEG